MTIEQATQILLDLLGIHYPWVLAVGVIAIRVAATNPGKWNIFLTLLKAKENRAIKKEGVSVPNGAGAKLIKEVAALAERTLTMKEDINRLYRKQDEISKCLAHNETMTNTIYQAIINKKPPTRRKRK